MNLSSMLGRALAAWAAVAIASAAGNPETSGPADALQPTIADARIAAALKDISGERVRANITALVGFGTRSSLSGQDAAAIASGRGVGAAREWIKGQFEQYSKDCGGCLEVKIDSYTQQSGERLSQPTVISNVYAVRRGTEAGANPRIVLVTGHYDSRNSDNFDITHDAPGANDDASGVAVSLECARVLSKLSFRGTVIFLAVAGEEQGLYGSEHFAQMARQNKWNVEAALNNDIVGGNRSTGQNYQVVRVFSEGVPSAATDKQAQTIRALGGEGDSPSRELARYIADTAAQYALPVRPLLVYRPDRFLRGGDHSSFNEQGYAAVRFTEYLEDYNRQHQTVRTEGGTEYGDLLKFVDTDYIANVARVNAATLASLASAPPPPAQVTILASKLENDSTLEWTASPGAAGYEVLWRATTSPTWEHAQAVGTHLTATLPMSKDNVFFAVRALDGQGHYSVPVVPEPKR